MSNTKKNTFNTGKPHKSNLYTVRYPRAKSKEVQTGTAYYTRGQGWSGLCGPRGAVESSYDSRRDRIYNPTILGWL